MTATPIPRTLALALYGEMAVSVIDEMPPGRTPVRPRSWDRTSRQRAYDLVRAQVALAARPSSSARSSRSPSYARRKSATAEFERLRNEVFPDLRMGLVHGRMSSKRRTR